MLLPIMKQLEITMLILVLAKDLKIQICILMQVVIFSMDGAQMIH